MPKVSTKDLPPISTETPDVLIPHPEIENAFTIDFPEEPPVKKLLKKTGTAPIPICRETRSENPWC